MAHDIRVTIGAVAYDPNVVTIGLLTELALYSSYERQVSPPFDHCMFDTLATLPEGAW